MTQIMQIPAYRQAGSLIKSVKIIKNQRYQRSIR